MTRTRESLICLCDQVVNADGALLSVHRRVLRAIAEHAPAAPKDEILASADTGRYGISPQRVLQGLMGRVEYRWRHVGGEGRFLAVNKSAYLMRPEIAAAVLAVLDEQP